MLIGRAEILDRVERELQAGARILTILGPPGMGKTTVAAAALRRFEGAATFAGGARFCDLSQARTEGELCFAVLSLFSDAQQSLHVAGDEVRTRLVDTLASLGPALVVLDNFEQLAFCSAIVGTWCQAAPELTLIVTSRERLAVAGEVVLELPPLACPQLDDADPLVNESEAVRLFLERARAAGGDGGADPSVLAAIVRRLDGIPLAIELAAARTRLLGAAELARRLDVGLDVLGTNRGVARHATLTKAIDWSWNLLPEEEQHALARCSVFAGSFTVDAAEHVAASIERIAALRDKSLIHATSDGRLALYVSIREYAGHRLLALGEAEAREPLLRHARFYAELAGRYNAANSLASNVAEPGLQRALRREKENLAAALAFVRRQPPGDETSSLQRDLAIAVAAVYAMPADACASALGDALAALRASADAEGAAAVLFARQLVWRELGRNEESLSDLEELRNAAGVPPSLRILALVMRGIQERYQGDPRTALATHERAARELDTLDLPRARAMNDACMGRLHCDLRNGAEARALNERSIAASEALGDLWLSGLALANLAQLAQDEGALDRAEALIDDAMSRLERAGEAHAAAIYATVRGDLLFERERTDAARRCYAEGGLYFGSLLTHRQAGILHAAAGALEATVLDFVAAAAHLEVATRSAARSGNPVVRRVVEAHRGTVELLRAAEGDRPALIARWTRWSDACERPTTNGELVASSMDVRFALRILRRTLGQVSASALVRLRLARDASWFVGGDGERVDLARRGALRRILVVLCDKREEMPGQGLGVPVLLETGWPGERVQVEAAATRVRVAVATLRRLGLRSVIVTREDGYLLDPRVVVERVAAAD